MRFHHNLGHSQRYWLSLNQFLDIQAGRPLADCLLQSPFIEEELRLGEG